MAKPDTIIIDGRAFSWQQLCERRRRQLEAWKTARGEQPTLFELKDDCRPQTELTPAGRYQEPSLFNLIAVRGDP